MREIPRQKLPFNEKDPNTSEGYNWCKNNIQARLEMSDFTGSQSHHKQYLKRLYDFYNGNIENNEYAYVTQPYGSTRQNYPARIRTYPIIKPIIDTLLGEKAKRPLNYQVIATNSDTVDMKEDMKHQEIKKNLYQQFLLELSRQGVPIEDLDEEPPPPEQVVEAFERNYRDQRAVTGQQILNYIERQQELHDKFQLAWFHFLVSGEVYTYRYVEAGETVYEILNPLDVDYDKDVETTFVEDADWAVVRRLLTPSSVIDKYYETLDDDQVHRIENPRNDLDPTYLYHYHSERSSYPDYRRKSVEEAQVFWKSRKKIGIVSWWDEELGLLEKEVDENYQLMEDETVEWLWVNEIWEGTRLDGDIFVNMRPLVHQRRNVDNLSICKLPINGRRYSDVNSENISLVSIGIPYQLMYDIYNYRLENAIARSKDFIAQFDINLIPSDMSMETFMYYTEATGIAWVDYNKEGVQLNPQHQTVLDLSVKTVQYYIELLQHIIMEWERVSGVNRQRQGKIQQYEGAGVTQAAIEQSSNITEDYHRKFSQLEKRDLWALLDYSKDAYVTGKKTSYVLDDASVATLEVDGMQHMQTEYGIFVSDSTKENEKLEYIRSLSEALVQNGAPLSTIIDVIDANSTTTMKDKVKKAERSIQELQQAQQQAERQQKDRELQDKQMERRHESEQNELDRQKDVQVALIRSGSTADVQQHREFREEMKDRSTEQLEQQKLQEEQRKNQKEEELREKEIEAQKEQKKMKYDS